MPTDDNGQGTPGAPPAAGAAGGSGPASTLDLQSLLSAPDAPPAAAPPPEDPFKDIPWDKVRAARAAGKLPEDVKKDLELPFLQEFTRKSQAFGQERERFLAGLVERLSARGVAASPEEKDQLREQLKESGIPLELVEQFIDRKLQPIVTETNSTRMEALAAAEHPWVTEKRAEIAEYIRTNPAAARLILANGGADGHFVVAGIARMMENEHLKAELKKREDGLPALRTQIAKDIIAELKKNGRILPSTTSQAGTGPTASSGETVHKDFKAAAIAAAKEGNFPL